MTSVFFFPLVIHNGHFNSEDLLFALLKKNGISYFSKENFERLGLKSGTVYFVFMVRLKSLGLFISECLTPGFLCKFSVFCLFLLLKCDANFLFWNILFYCDDSN